MKGPSINARTASYTRELGRYTNGVNNDGTSRNSFWIIPCSTAPLDVIQIYRKQYCTIRPNKSETHRVHLIVGGEKVSYNSPVTSPIVE